ncbi:uncharacterized protein LOC127262696 [Andrographis paniculata]|uniref:uncharacterized protein LOC127262696 n=1 Tax=Andrographis paniculata TaxID=175694 RepID=UPI0021E95CA9|nr:uncharacterized protein LOC127262696 [Andrographis paniculata]
MASHCKFASLISRRVVSSVQVARGKAAVPKPAIASAFPSSYSKCPVTTSRFACVVISLETMLPLHSAIASSRLKSNIAMDTTCWSWLSRDFAVPR